MTGIRRLTKSDFLRLRQFWVERWGGEIIIVLGEIIQYNQVDGFIYDDWLGLITFVIHGNECEITSLDSLQEGKGIGTVLINAVISEAREKKCRRVAVVTTNDNLQALGFYQRRGFELVAVHRGAITESRKRKPSIASIGQNNIPLRDEIELEMNL